jgi:Tol biopolymer transport system component
MRRIFLITALTLIATASAGATAQATFPGENGSIVYRQVDPATDEFALLRARPDGTHASELTDRPGFFSDWRADGRRIAFDYFDADGNQQIATINANGSDLREITSGPGMHEVPSWSPDGKTIAFDFSPQNPGTPGFEARLWTMRADGSHAEALPMQQPGFDVEPKYSPDGRWIAFSRLREGSHIDQAAIFLVGADGGRVDQITPWGDRLEHPTWSPDGRWIIFSSPEGTIEMIRPDGRGRHTILAPTEAFGGHKPVFSPDGTKILFVCGFVFPDGNFNDDLCLMDRDGSNIVNVTHAPATHENWPSWGPRATTSQG